LLLYVLTFLLSMIILQINVTFVVAFCDNGEKQQSDFADELGFKKLRILKYLAPLHFGNL